MIEQSKDGAEGFLELLEASSKFPIELQFRGPIPIGLLIGMMSNDPVMFAKQTEQLGRITQLPASSWFRWRKIYDAWRSAHD